MSLISKFIDKNSPLLESMSEDNPELSVALLDALALMGQYMEEKNIVFTEEEEKQILESTEPIIFEQKVDAELKNIETIIEKSKEDAELKPSPTLEKSENVNWELLKLKLIESLGLHPNINANEFDDFWNAIKDREYQNNPKNIPSQGYDKLYVKASFWGKGQDAFDKQRLDIGLSDYNPFTSPNILFDSLIDDYIHKLYFCYFGFENVKSQFGEATELEYLLNHALKLFNFDYSVPKEYFANKIVSTLKDKLESDYWKQRIIERRDYELSKKVKTFDYSQRIKERYETINKRYTDDEIKYILSSYVPETIYNWLFYGKDVNFIYVYDLAWLTPNEDGDIEYVKNQLGMPYDYEKAYGFQSEASQIKEKEQLVPTTMVLRTDYFTEKMPKELDMNNMVFNDIIIKCIDISKQSEVRMEIVGNNGKTLNVSIFYDASNLTSPFTTGGDIVSNGDKDQIRYNITKYFDDGVYSVEIQCEQNAILDTIFYSLNNQFPITAFVPTESEMKNETKVEEQEIENEQEKVAQIQHAQHTHFKKDELDLSDEDIKALESLGEIEDDDLEGLDDLIENL
jgi:hypothetical protein